MPLDFLTGLQLLNLTVIAGLVAATAVAMTRSLTNHRELRALFVLLLVLALWSIASLGRALSADLQSEQFWLNAYFIAVSLFGPAWMFVAFQPRRGFSRPSRLALSLLAIPGTLGIPAVLTNPLHGLFFLSVEHTGAVGGLTYTRGPLNIALVGVTYAYLVIGGVTYWRLSRSAPRWRRSVYRLVLGCVAVGCVGTSAALLFPLPIRTDTVVVILVSMATAVGAARVLRVWVNDVARLGMAKGAEHLGGALAVLDVDGAVTDVNSVFSQLAGMTRQDLLDLPLADLAAVLRERIAGFDQVVAAIHQRTCERGKPISLDLTVSGARPRVFDTIVQPIEGRGGLPIGFVISMRDVTARRAAERALKESEARFRRLVENAPDAIFRMELTPDRKMTYVSPAVAAVLGYGPEDFTSDRVNYEELVHPDDRHLLGRLPDGSIREAVVIRWIHRDGHIVWAEHRHVPVFDDGGRLVAVEGIVRDVTSQKLAEEALRESEARYRELFENSSDIVYTHDLQGVITSLNRAGERLLGISRSEAVGMSIGDILTPGLLASARRTIERGFARRKPANFEVEVVRRGGQTRVLEVSSQPMYRDGEPFGVHGVARDVTETRALTRSLAKSVEDLAALHDVAASLNSAPDATGILREALLSVSRLMKPDRAWALVLDDKGDMFSLQAELDRNGRIMVTPVDRTPCPISRGILDTGQPRFVDDVEAEGASRSSVMDEAVLAYAALPLKTPDRGEGLLYVASDRPRAHPLEDRYLLEVVANHAGIALGNVRKLGQLRRAAITDPLTKLPNHRHLIDRLDHEMARARKNGSPLAILLMDVDDLKLVNETHGQAVGDELLRQVANTVRDTLRPTDILGRFGGDEFLALLPGTDGDGARVAALRVMEAVRALSFEAQSAANGANRRGVRIPVRLSVGMAIYPQDSASKLDLIDLADAAMYSSKRRGGDILTQARTTDSAFLASQHRTFGVLEGLVNTVDAKDQYTGVHSEMVARYSVAMAEALGMSSATRDRLRVAGLLHDVGKIGVTDRILRKPGPLTDDEYSTVRQHPVLGEMIIRQVPRVALEIRDSIRYHHERYDGKGYPRGLKGEEIPLVARVVAIADAYSAMVIDRPYRRGLSDEEAIARLREGAGTQFDPALVDLFVRLLAAAGQRAPDSEPDNRVLTLLN